ncbi:MAG: gfo/Idh/MocA family oxidoreductase [Desulfovibrio sp.]|nr:MAG: gfo/Idh/MocA family oxidoreductase [Desulfovibrio sp.]
MTEDHSPALTRTPLTYGMVGGGPGGFIGQVHRQALAMDGLAQLTAGFFARDETRCRETALDLRVPQDRIYSSAQEMADKEAEREDRIDFVAVVTPNHVHYPICKAFLQRGFHVVCDKPLTLEIHEAEDLAELAEKHGLMFGVTHAYNGYPMVKQARAMVAAGELGELRYINGEYAQDWLWQRLELTEHKQAGWRLDPKRTGRASTLGDIGTHLDNLATYITGLTPTRLLARVEALVPGRVLDDTATVMLEYEGGVSGLFWLSQAAVGHDNGLKLRVMGEKASLEWSQEAPDTLIIKEPGGPSRTVSRARGPMYPEATVYSRFPSGHPEGYLECFANTYKAFCSTLIKRKAGLEPNAADLDFPGVEAGIKGVRFIHRCVDSSERGAAWVDFAGD